jgi:hypothetical protein
MMTITCNNCQTDNLDNSKYCKSCGYELPKNDTHNVDEKVGVEVENKKNTMSKKILGTIIGVLVFFLTYYAVQYFFFQPPSFDKAMMSAASELNKTCPIMIDQYTRLDNAMALPNNSFQYNYTLINIDKSEVNLDTVKKYIEPNIINNVKTNPDLKIYRENKTTMIYNYRDKNGVFVVKIAVTPEMYK